MTEQDILDLIEQDIWMMSIITTAEALNLPDWLIGAGFVRNKVWDHLHGYSKEKVETNDIDLVYYDREGNDQNADEKLSEELRQKTGINWEVVNEYYAHIWNGLPQYESSEDAISTWPETVTAIGVTRRNGKLMLIAPYGIEDLINLIIRPAPRFAGGIVEVQKRAEKKCWLTKWPKLRMGA